MKRYFPHPFTLLSVALLFLGAPPFNLYFLAWVGLIPWLWTISDQKKLRYALVQGFWLAVLCGATICYWIVTVAHDRKGYPYTIAVPIGVVFWCFMQPQFVIFPWVAFKKLQRSRKLTLAGILGLSFAFAALDTYLPRVFQCGIALYFYHAPNLRQVVDLGGLPLLTFIIAFVNIAIWDWAHERFQMRRLLAVGLSLGLCATGTLYGYLRNAEVAEIIAKSQTRAHGLVIQAFSFTDNILDHYIELSNSALTRSPGMDFVMWPESSFRGTYRGSISPQAKAQDQKIETLVRSQHVSLVFGDKEVDHREQKVFNALSILDPSARLQIYKKTLLMPLGESMPGDDFLPAWWRKHRPGPKMKMQGPGPAVLTLSTSFGPVLVNPIICYEGTVPDYSLAGARLGSRLIMNSSGDGEFVNTTEPELHLMAAAFASIETRLPQIRATDSGISALILPNGDIQGRTPLGVETTAAYDIPITEPIPSLMRSWGSWFHLISIAGSFLLLF